MFLGLTISNKAKTLPAWGSDLLRKVNSAFIKTLFLGKGFCENFIDNYSVTVVK